MIKKSIFCLLCLLFAVAGGRGVFASNFDGFLRIGLEQYFLEQSQITVYSTRLEIGIWQNSAFNVHGAIYSHSSFSVMPANLELAQLPMLFPTFAEAREASLHFSQSAPAMLGDGMWTLYVPIAYAAAHGGTQINASNQRIAIFAGPQLVLVTEGAVQLRDTSAITNLGVRQYRGVIEFARFRGQGITAVNIIHIDEYLLSVVPSEMPASWHIEALRAQAVAARTFTLHRKVSWTGRDYDLCDTVFSQVYSGIGREHANTTQAVNDTRNLIMLHNGQPILAVYSSCAGGHTANSEEVWVATVPYLRGVQEVHQATDMLWSRTITMSQINQLLTGEGINIGSATSVELITNENGRVMQLIIRGQNGNHTLQQEHIRTFFNPLQGGGLRSRNFTITGATTAPISGSLVAPPPTASASTQTYVIGASGLATINPGYIVSLSAAGLGFAHDGQIILGAGGVSLLNTTQTASPPQTTPTQTGQALRITSNSYTLQLEGAGWGHGVGMSQHGARAMAQMGYDFTQILLFYYTGIEIALM